MPVRPFDKSHLRERLDLPRIKFVCIVLDHQPLEFVGNGSDGKDLLLADAENVVVESPSVDDVARSLGQIGRFIDDHRRIARAGDDGLFGAAQRGLGHAWAAGDQQQADVRVVEQFVGRLDGRRFDRSHQIGRAASPDDGLIDQAHREHGDLSARRMYVEDDRVARGDNANGVVDHRRHGMRRWSNRADDSVGCHFYYSQPVITGPRSGL